MPQAKKKAAKKTSAQKASPKKATAKKTAAKKSAPKATRSATAAKSAGASKKAATKKSVKKNASSADATKSKAKAKSAKPSGTVAEGGPFKGFQPYAPKKGEEYMSESMEEHFRQLLRAWKRELMEEVDRTVHHMQDEAANFPDPNDRATQESEFSLELRARDRERKLIKKIDEALNRLEIGEYGYCESCGVEIGIRRLEARPTAELCIDCKTLDEIRERQMG